VPDRGQSDQLRAVRLHYLQDMTMEAIAREMGTSRSTVSRLLAHARSTGLVEFRVREPGGAAPDLERRLAHELGIEVRVVPTPRRESEAETLDRVCKFAARTLTPTFESHMTLGVAWGTTMSALSRHLPHKPTVGSRVVQLNGAGNTHTSGITYASQILQRFGDAFDARVDAFPVPTFFDYPDTKIALWRERSVRRVLALQAAADVAVFSVGAVHGGVPSHVYSGGYLEEQDYGVLVREHVVGDVATVFLREDGTSDISLNERSSGPDLDVLRAIPNRMCVAAGRHRVPGMRGAVAAGLVTCLVTDEETAAALLERVSGPGAAAVAPPAGR